nr:MAG TPA: putative tail protein [Caudoviricetes sp.]
MIIYDIHNNKILDATLTEGAEHEQELGRSDLIRLSWQSDVKLTLPAGSYITPFDDGLKYRLLSPYTPTEDDKGFKYTPEFQHPLMWLSRVPFLYDTTDADKNPIKQQEWSFEGLTTNALEYACKAINEALNITTENEKFTFTLCGNVDSSVSFSVSSNDILSVLSSIAQGCKNNACEWHLSWKHKALYFGQISINLGEDVPTLKVHENIQKASVSDSKEPYYNCFYPQGATKNMSTKALVGTGNVATLARLGLDKSVYPDGYIYVDTEGNVITKDAFEASGEIKQTLALSFDDVYPHIDLYVYNVRKYVRYLKNSQTNTIELDSRGNKKTYTIWYMRLAFPSVTKIADKTVINITHDKDESGNIITHYWYDYEIDRTKQVLQGYTLKGIFKVNTHAIDGHYDALTQGLVGQPNGQEGFELHYHEVNNPIAAKPNEGDSGVDILKGDYEILKYQSGDTIIPTNESEGLYPRGNTLPDLTCNMIVLFNIVMGEHETKLAQEELAARTIKEIKRRVQDNNNYSFSSNAVAFANKNPKLYIGQKVTFDDGFGYQLKTRVIKLVTKLDYPIIQEITVGNQAVKGTISQLKEDVNNILSGNFSGGGLNSTQTSELIKNYVDPRFLRKNIPDTAQEVITFLKGIEFGDDFVKDGSGAGIYKDDNGQWHIDADYLHARKKLTAEEVEVMKTSHIKGKVVNSAGGFVISRIEKINGAWRCYFVQQDSEGRRVYNYMRENDLALCETFNLVDAGGQLSNHYWHRRVVEVGTDYVDIADNTNAENYASGSDVPQVGDEVVQLGNLTVKERQSAIIQSAAGEGAPYFKIIKGINSFILPDPIFLFDNQKFEIRVENPSRQGEYIPLQAFLDSMQGRINSVQQQADKQLVIWFGDAVPTLTTEPANEWADNTTKELHEHDIYYNRSYVETGGGRAYSFERNPDGSFSWHEITDADVLKSLEAAKHAQDTADGKRRVFVRDIPTPPYDAGDQWTNATFPDKYNNDLLVCVRPKTNGESFDIEDWQSAQNLTSAQFKSEIKTAADKISATVTNLKNGLVEVGFELDGEKKTFDIVADRFKVRTTTGIVPFFTDGEKLNAYFIDAKEIVAKGIKAQTIDAKGATFQNITVTGDSTFEGTLKGTSGSFTSLDCLDGTNKVGGIKFGTMGNKGYMAFTGDFGMLGETTGDIRKRFHNFYATNIYCNSQFGHKSRVCAVVKDDEMFVYNDGHIENGIRIALTFNHIIINGRNINYYRIPMYSPGFGGESGKVMDIDNLKAEIGTQTYFDELPVGVPIDVIIFNGTKNFCYEFFGMGYGKQWTVINGNDDTSVTICCHGGTFDVHGGYILDCCYVNPAWLSPSSVDVTSPGAGVMVGRELDMNW